MAVNCWVVPAAITGVTGFTAIELRVALLTVRVVTPATVPSTAVMVTVPGATPRASPRVPAPLEIVAKVTFEEVQLTRLVMSWVLLSE